MMRSGGEHAGRARRLTRSQPARPRRPPCIFQRLARGSCWRWPVWPPRRSSHSPRTRRTPRPQPRRSRRRRRAISMSFMEKALARREVNRKVLDQYVLDETEAFEILGPGRWPLHRTKREFTWYEQDGMHVRSPVRFDGVAVGEEPRRALRGPLDPPRARAPGAEGEERARERQRDHRPGGGAGRHRVGGGADRAALRVGSVFHGLQVRARQLLPRRPREARRARRPAHRVLPHEPVQRRRRREDAAGDQEEVARDGQGPDKRTRSSRTSIAR